MTLPNTPDKFTSQPITSAAALLAHRRATGQAPAGDPPASVIFCMQPALFDHGRKQYRGQAQRAFMGDFVTLRRTPQRVGLVGRFGVGAPVTAVLLEDFAAWGVREFVLIGIAGGLQPDAQPGDIVLVDGAIRDEGTSHHYLPSGTAVAPDAALQARLAGALAAAGVPHRSGPTWTTDAPYRETAVEVAAYRARGILTVEMEAAAFLAVAQVLQVAAVAALVVADTLTAGRWQLTFPPQPVHHAQTRLLAAAIGN